VIDVGTGSGILAIAMRVLGIKRVTAIDNDATALGNALENAALNHITNGIDFSTTPIARVKGKSPLVVANILSSTLIAMAPDLKRILAKNGFLVLGGILAREVKKVAAHYAPELRLIDKRVTKGWATLVFSRNEGLR
jgi:ribosomal protein L11 methyltransferase